MKNIHLSKKSYFIAFLIVMLLNTGLAVFLINNVTAQTAQTSFKDQKPINVEVEEQKDCPIRINFYTVNNDEPNFQIILFNFENVGLKPIRAYTLLINDKRGGQKVITSFHSVKLFQKGEVKNAEEFIERQNIKNDNQAFSLSLDYIEFDDGSFWGNDTKKKSTLFLGLLEGKKSAIKNIRNSIKNLNASQINEFYKIINQDLLELNVDTSNINQSEEWKNGFRLGYRSVFSILQRVSDKSVENLTKQLNELEKINN
jgi:hypothetical protein